MVLGPLLLIAAIAAQQPPAPQPFPRPGRSQRVRRRRHPRRPTAATPAARRRGAGAWRRKRRRRKSRSACRSIPARSSSRRSTPDAASATPVRIAASFVDLVAFYRDALKQKGELVFDAPATHDSTSDGSVRRRWRFRPA